MISVLCIGDHRSNYRLIPGLDLWDAERDAYNFTGSNPVIAHPPCQQWSQLRGLPTVKAIQREKDLAFFCLEKVQQNGGILEHPRGSSFFKVAGITPTISINQSWFGFPARKTTYLYFHGYKPLPHPLSFDPPSRSVQRMWGAGGERSRQPLAFCEWLIKSIERGCYWI